MGKELRKLAERLRRHALSMPGATEHFPWGERVAKVNGKVFAFLGSDAGENAVTMSVKLPQSAAAALDRPFAAPTGYGLGRSGWVSVRFESGESADADLLCAWIEESWRAIAPKRLQQGPATPRKRKSAGTGARRRRR